VKTGLGERNRMVQELRWSVKRYRALIQHSREAFCRYEGKPVSLSLPRDQLFDHVYHHAQVVECNDAFARMHGKKMAKGMIGIRLADILDRTDLQNVEFLRAVIRSDAGIQEIDCSQRDAHGDVRWISRSAFRVVENGRLLGAWCVQRDVTRHKLAEQALRESEERYRSIFNNSLDAILLTVPDGRILEANPAACRMFRRTEKELRRIGRAGLVDVDDPRQGPALAERARAGFAREELTFVRSDGTRFTGDTSSGVFTGGDGLLRTSMVIRDTTDRKRIEETLREASQFSQQVIDNAHEGIVVCGRDLRYRVWNPYMEKLTGIPAAEILGQHPLDVFPFLREVGIMNLLEGTLAGAEPETLDFPYQVPQTGRSGWASQISTPLRNSKGEIVGVIRTVHEITERKRAEEALRQSREQLRGLAARLQAVREEERTRVAREIHDVLAQELTRLKMDIVWLNRRLAQPLDDLKLNLLQERLGVMTDLTDTAIRSVQKIATELRPVVLDSLGLSAAIEWQAKDFQANTGIHCEVILPGQDIPLDHDRSTAVFRILQESLTNVARHAGATSVEVQLQCEAAQLTLSVGDNGRGILDSELNDPHSVGLLGMRERALLLGGQCQIIGRTGEGTVVEVRIPLPLHNGSQNLP
jgi:PAS domain S-box-containing protein